MHRCDVNIGYRRLRHQQPVGTGAGLGKVGALALSWPLTELVRRIGELLCSRLRCQHHYHPGEQEVIIQRR
jgi:hypothetical protein